MPSSWQNCLARLSRLRIWLVLFALTLLQGGIMACSLALFGGEQAWWSGIVGLATTLRPWLEIIFAAFVGMYASTLASSAMMALVAAYGAVVLVRFLTVAACGWALPCWQNWMIRPLCCCPRWPRL